jgi:hypothetical protein
MLLLALGFQILICCSFCNCIFFLKVEKFTSAMIKGPETIATEMSGVYVKKESMSLYGMEMIYHFLYAIWE